MNLVRSIGILGIHIININKQKLSLLYPSLSQST